LIVVVQVGLRLKIDEVEVVENVKGEDGSCCPPCHRKPALAEELLKVAVTLQVGPASTVGDLHTVRPIRVDHHEVARPKFRARTLTPPVAKLYHKSEFHEGCRLECAVAKNLDAGKSWLWRVLMKTYLDSMKGKVLMFTNKTGLGKTRTSAVETIEHAVVERTGRAACIGTWEDLRR
jgi:hypothetical protein